MSDEWLVASIGPRIAVLDASDRSAVTARGASEPLGDLVRKIALRDDYAFVTAEDAGFHVFDLSGPEPPTHVAGVDLGGDTRGIALMDNVALVSGWGVGLVTFDISDPTNPRRLGGLTDLRSAQDVAVSGNTAFVSYLSDGVRAVDVSDPSHPTALSHFQPGDGAADGLAVSGTTLWVAGTVDMTALDVTDPSAPVRLSSTATQDRAWSVTTSGTRVYLSDGKAGVRMFEAIDPTSPREIVRISTPGDALNASAIGQRIAVADWLTGVWLTDVTNAASPVDLGRWPVPGYAKAVDVAGDMAWVGQPESSVLGFDVHDPSQPRDAALAEIEGQELGVAADEERVFVTEIGSMKLWAYDVMPDGSLHEASTYPVRGRSAKLVGDTLYITRGADGVEAIDVTDTANVLSLDRINTPGYALRSDTAHGFLYVADRQEGVRIIDVRNPSDMRDVASFLPPSEGALDVAVAGTVLYVAAADGGLITVDVSDPASPLMVGQVTLPTAVGYATVVAATETWAFVGHPSSGMQVIDVRDPADPNIAQYIPLPSGIEDIAVSGDRVFVAVGGAGLVVLEPSGVVEAPIEFLDAPVPVEMPTQQDGPIPTVAAVSDLDSLSPTGTQPVAATARTEKETEDVGRQAAPASDDAPAESTASGQGARSDRLIVFLTTRPAAVGLLAVVVVALIAVVTVALLRR